MAVLEHRMAPRSAPINNAFYDHLGERWFTAQDDPVALLRAEGATKQAWVEAQLREWGNAPRGAPRRILDIGCGAGFLTRHLANLGYAVQGLDRSWESLRMARSRGDGSVGYHQGDALRLPFGDGVFDIVCAMDFLEHVEDPVAAVAEAGRVLRPGGWFFFHTFNRNFLSWLIVIKGLEWFVRNTPRRMHVARLFIRPAELAGYCDQAGMTVRAWTGIRPQVFRRAFFRLLIRGVVPHDFRFVLTPSRRLAYLGRAEKSASP